MIPVTKGNAPSKLLAEGVVQKAALCQEFDLHSVAYKRNQKSFAFSDQLYGHVTVRSALEMAQHGKCCYCEVVIPKPYAPVHVEHYRPKAYSQQELGSPRIYPGYYWLAYDWDNLFLSCLFCNSSNKRNLFPIGNQSKRALNHRSDIFMERSLILCPSGPENPRDHIEFYKEVPRGKTRRGKVTVAALGLSRSEHEPRLTRYVELEDLRNEVLRWQNDPSVAAQHLVSKCRALLIRATQANAPWSAMAQDYLSKNPLP
jgi:uncharacterized protein (TIGR02646 family)